jgi:hypothetical protein
VLVLERVDPLRVLVARAAVAAARAYLLVGLDSALVDTEIRAAVRHLQELDQRLVNLDVIGDCQVDVGVLRVPFEEELRAPLVDKRARVHLHGLVELRRQADLEVAHRLGHSLEAHDIGPLGLPPLLRARMDLLRTVAKVRRKDGLVGQVDGLVLGETQKELSTSEACSPIDVRPGCQLPLVQGPRDAAGRSTKKHLWRLGALLRITARAATILCMILITVNDHYERTRAAVLSEPA